MDEPAPQLSPVTEPNFGMRLALTVIVRTRDGKIKHSEKLDQ